MMDGFFAIRGIATLVILFILLFPVVKILRKAGYSGWWVLLWFVPVGNLIALWIFAFADWPALRGRALPPA